MSLLALLGACVHPVASDSRPEGGLEWAPEPSPELAVPQGAAIAVKTLEKGFARRAGRRLHLQLDRPLVRPGETVSGRLWDLGTRELEVDPDAYGTVTLLTPRGVAYRTWAGRGGAFSFALPDDAAGGRWSLQARAGTSQTTTRAFTVASFESPRLVKELAFAADSYGPGAVVEASVELRRATGEALAHRPVVAELLVGGERRRRYDATTDVDGTAELRVELPAAVSDPDVLLSVLVEDGGVTESITRPVPVVIEGIDLAFFPEGGDWVQGLASRVYFEATDAGGAPAAARGVVVDDRGAIVGALETVDDGRGRISLTPRPGRSYTAVIREPGGASERHDLPAALPSGCVLRHHDDLDGALQAVRVSVSCTEPRDVVVVAMQQDHVLDSASLRVSDSATAWLSTDDPHLAGARGVARITVLDSELAPLAERLVFRNRTRALQVALSADAVHVAPGGEVELTVQTLDADGRPVPAELALSVVDDRLLSHADDDGDSLESRLLLQADLPEPLEVSADLFDPDLPDRGLALDLALGTRGWRRIGLAPPRGPYDPTGAEVLTREFLLRIPVGRNYSSSVQMAAGVVGGGGNPNMAGGASNNAVMRLFAPPRPGVELRERFAETAHWSPSVRTGVDGRQQLRFALTDALTGFRVRAEGVGAGLVGAGELLVSTELPLSVDARLPVALTVGDRALLPVTVENTRAEAVEVELTARLGPLLALASDAPHTLSVPPRDRVTVHLPVEAQAGRGEARVELSVRAGALGDGLVRALEVQPSGVPRTWSGSGVLGGDEAHRVDLSAALSGSVVASISAWPSSATELMQGLEDMVQTPGGCFEQTSSTNYPNVLILSHLGEDRAARRRRVLEAGYRGITGYQVRSGGFETWGEGPGKEALSAYGLVQLTAMDAVFDVEEGVLARNRQYLLGQRTGRGGFHNTGHSAHGYGSAPVEVLDAYITWALVRTGHTELDAELDAQASRVARDSDPYRLALGAMALAETRPEDGARALMRLAALQDRDGSFPGAETSIMRSGGQNLLVESTALAALALWEGGFGAEAVRAVHWLREHRRGGLWGATQANVLALEAVAAIGSGGPAEGSLVVWVDGRRGGRLTWDGRAREPLELPLALEPGVHEVQLTHEGRAIPYALQATWAEVAPRSDPTRRVDVEVALQRPVVAMGETVRMTVRLHNRTDEVVPDPIARIGLPAGLEPQLWQLEQVVERTPVALTETRPREVTAYWDGIAPGEVHEVSLDLVAAIPGTYQAPATSAYPYYDDHAKAWAAGVTVEIAPP